MLRGTWNEIRELAKRQGVVTPAEVRGMGLAAENLNKMAKLGLLVRSGRGTYEHPDFEHTEHHSYVEVAKTFPKAVFCLLTALRIHDVGTQNPHQVWIAVPRDLRPPKARTAELRVVQMSPLQYGMRIENLNFEGVDVRVYSLEKTLVDCFRLRRLVGHDVPIEALKDALQTKKVRIDSLMEIAAELRCSNLIRPYLEAMSG